LCCFNDDIQDTGAMGLAGLYAAARIVGKPLADQRILFVGAGEACLGIGGLVMRAMRRDGVPDSEARRRCLFVDSHGLLVASRADLAPHKRAFAQDLAPQSDLPTIIERLEPTVLIGACAVSGAFSQSVLAAMARVSPRPIVWALSNPTSKSECTAEQAYAWTQGRAIFASGSPFDPVELDGRVHAPSQANNACVFPGLGLGLLVSGAARATDEMLLAAADAVSRQVSDADLERGRIFPAASRLRDVATAVAAAVAETAYDQGHASKPRSSDVRAEILSLMYEPQYPAADRAGS
jgi:malate dehydrogenase (oxaloacetate-decarboxylating)(NADP+)